MERNLNTKISALLITYNEAHNLKEVLDNISFADEIIVVDSFSTDATPKIAKSFSNVLFTQRAFKNYTDQKQFALNMATNPWVLFIDADERVTKDLREEILKTVKKEDACQAYYFVRKFMFKDKPLNFSGWQTDKNYRLFQKDAVHFETSKIVHETLVVNGSSGTLKNKLIHYSYNNYEDYKGKMVSYGKMRALEEFKKGKQTNWFLALFRPFWKFFNHFIIRLGFLDGKKGLTISYLNALGVAARYKELKRLNRQNG